MTTPPAESSDRSISQLVAALCEAFDSGRTQDASWRLDQLDALRRLLEENEDRLFGALHEDLGKPATEAWAGELGFLVAEINFARKNLRRWMRPTRVSTPLACQPGKSWTQPQPLGLVLIIGAWNYPVGILLGPLVGAIAAGNTAILKPSEQAPATAAVIDELLPRYLDTDCFSVVPGGADETGRLLAQRFDLIFYTGGAAVGKIVMRAAAEQLAPVVLELGGKCPVIVDRDVDPATAGRRIAWGRFMNAGQTCVAPDYVLADADIEEALIEGMVAAVEEFFGARPELSDDYGRIINSRHTRRLADLLGKTTARPGPSFQTVIGGRWDVESRYFAPTILKGVSPDSPIMGEEIFGPILPVISVSGIDEALEFLRPRPKPLAVYAFTHDKQVERRILQETTSGGVCINDVVMHLTALGLPFGGVGASGMGAYHGRHSFEAFSHQRAVMRRTLHPDLKLRYPPYDEKKLKWLRRLM
ncbi:MAG: aldehyde dehydrogenase family protein, partial [Planctomycetota bacterium]|nr:aldehyde dehydrogenase family protein [Planctomycetota bacterium]